MWDCFECVAVGVMSMVGVAAVALCAAYVGRWAIVRWV